MTRERAAELLSGVKVLDDPEMEEAHKMAISALRQQEHRCPCDLCNFGPPSSMRGKPCTMCPAVPKQETVTERNELTNADRIRGMSDEELEVFIEQIIPINCDCCVYMKLCRLEYDEETVNYAEKYSCRDGIMKWLQQPAGGG